MLGNRPQFHVIVRRVALEDVEGLSLADELTRVQNYSECVDLLATAIDACRPKIPAKPTSSELNTRRSV